ncbi:MAG: IclR family transcriptional regulator [Streptosporangiaceae bacterium]
MAGNSTEPGRSVASKVAAILLTFQADDKHSLTEIARSTGLPVSTAHRLVTELEGSGLLERTHDADFRAGLPLQAISHGTSYSPGIVESARPVLEDLATAARTRARLGILVGWQVACMEKHRDHSPVTSFGHGPRLPAHATALGKVLLAFSPAEVLDQIIADGLQRYTPHTLTDPEKLRRCLTATRRTRLAFVRWEFQQGTSAVAVPVFGAGGAIVAALELTVSNLCTDLHAATYVLMVAARGISRELVTVPRTGHFAPTTDGHNPPPECAPDVLQRVRRVPLDRQEVLQVS